jgi:hypothetical protein
MTVFLRITCDSITIVYVRDRIRRNTETVNGVFTLVNDRIVSVYGRKRACFEKWWCTKSQDVHSGRRNGALYGRKRRFTALISTLFHRNPSVRITTAVSGRFLLRNDHRFTPFLNTFLD